MPSSAHEIHDALLRKQLSAEARRCHDRNGLGTPSNPAGEKNAKRARKRKRALQRATKNFLQQPPNPLPGTSTHGSYTGFASCTVKKKEKRSDITPDPGLHRPQHPCAQGRTRVTELLHAHLVFSVRFSTLWFRRFTHCLRMHAVVDLLKCVYTVLHKRKHRGTGTAKRAS